MIGIWRELLSKQMDNRYLISYLCPAVFFVLLVVSSDYPANANANANSPAIFILGDSTADVGTNNFLLYSKARADFPYYGIDFPKRRATGRFSNGLNSADFLAKLMGYKRSPRPFFSLGGLANYLLKRPSFRGLNFASAGSGLLDMTGSTLGVVPLSEQIKQFAAIKKNLTVIRGSEAAEAFLCKSLFFISIGSNDFFGYLSSNSTIPPPPPPAEFLSILINAYDKSIRTLYSLGARKFGIISVPPIGCCPSLRLLNETGGCLESLNGFAESFHSALDNLLSSTSTELEGMKYSLGNAYAMTINVIQNPYPFNFTNVDTACCGFGVLNAEQPCNATANLCPNRVKYIFWDEFHPTQAAARLAAQTLFAGPPEFVTPINFSQLAKEN